MADSGIKINKICLFLYCVQKGKDYRWKNNMIMRERIADGVTICPGVHICENSVIGESDLEEERKLR